MSNIDIDLGFLCVKTKISYKQDGRGIKKLEEVILFFPLIYLIVINRYYSTFNAIKNECPSRST